MNFKKLVKATCAIVMAGTILSSVPVMPAEAVTTKATQTDITYIKQVFDADYYYTQYSDVANVFGNNPDALLNHYISYGITEGRNASATFNATTYKNNYADLSRVFGNNIYSYFKHYVQYGKTEGRNAIDANGQAAAPAAEEVQQIGTVIATYSTSFNANIPRATNVRLAASQVNGKILQPQETFSFLNSILPRTVENGYVEAPIFVSGKHSTGIGGGICQVSSTIYAAVVSTNCTIVERHSHSLPVSYVPTGMDATVSAPSLDFRFTNTYSQPMLITATTSEDGILTVTISLQ